MKKIIISVLAVLLAAGIAGAQTKAETSLYTKTLKKPSIKAYDKFLNKYPESVYRLEVLTLRDTELFESVDKDDAYISQMEDDCEQYAYTRKNAWRASVPDGSQYGLDPRYFDSEQEYLEALNEEKCEWN